MSLPIYTNNDRRWSNINAVVREAINEHASTLNIISGSSFSIPLNTVQDVLDNTTDEGDGGNARGLAGNYYLESNIDIGDLYFVTPTNGATYSIVSALRLLTSTSTNPMFSEGAGITGNTLLFENVFISSPNAATFNILSGSSLITKTVGFFACQSVGTYNGDFLTMRATAFVASGDGLSVQVLSEVQVDTFQYNNGADTGGTGLTISGAGQGAIITGIASHPMPSESAIDIQASYTGVVSITGGTHDNVGPFFKGPRDQNDSLITVNNVVGVINSQAIGSMHLDGNALPTTITAIGVAVKVNAAWDEVSVSRFTTDTTGRMTYVGKDDFAGTVSLLCFMDSGGGTDTLSVYIAINGVFVAITKGTSDVASNGSQISTVSGITLTENDYIEAFIANESDTSDITVKTASFNIG